jgi:hypothetical protein
MKKLTVVTVGMRVYYQGTAYLVETIYSWPERQLVMRAVLVPKLVRRVWAGECSA